MDQQSGLGRLRDEQRSVCTVVGGRWVFGNFTESRDPSWRRPKQPGRHDSGSHQCTIRASVRCLYPRAAADAVLVNVAVNRLLGGCCRRLWRHDFKVGEQERAAPAALCVLYCLRASQTLGFLLSGVIASAAPCRASWDR